MGKVQIAMGAFAPKISVQLADMGFDENQLEAIDKDADAITRLYVRGLIPATQRDAARRKLVKSIENLNKK